MSAAAIPSTIPQGELDLILNRIPASFSQAVRLVKFLAWNTKAVTVEVNQNCAIGNISDVAHKINPILYQHGYMIGCEKPLQPVPNRYGEQSNMFLWSVYKLPNASNDPHYGAAS